PETAELWRGTHAIVERGGRGRPGKVEALETACRTTSGWSLKRFARPWSAGTSTGSADARRKSGRPGSTADEPGLLSPRRRPPWTSTPAAERFSRTSTVFHLRWSRLK